MPSQNNVENLLDIDFDGSAPASLQKENHPIPSGTEGLNGTPEQSNLSSASINQSANNLDDLMGVFGHDTVGPDQPGTNNMANTLADLSLEPAEPNLQADSRKNKDDIMDLF